MDLTTAIDAVHREIADTTRDGRAARMIVAERTYPSPADDVWDALTNPERLPRWFLPVSGDLRLGGRYQLEGNAGGSITACEPPRHLAVTWEYDGGLGWVDVWLTSTDDGTALRLEHAAPVDALAQMGDFGPGAVGVGWDLTLAALAEHLVTGQQVEPDLTDETSLAFMRRSAEAWGRADIAYGTPVEQAEAAAARTAAAYTGG